MLIHFVHTGSAYLPELNAYHRFLETRGHQAQTHRDTETIPSGAQVVWWMCGRVPHGAARRLGGAVHVHEYASASVPPLAWPKDRAKRWLQPVPHYRLFQNAWVRDRMGFADAVPHEFRDMGIDTAFLEAPPHPLATEFDFVYLGDMQRLRHFLPVFAALEQLGRRTLLIGEAAPDLGAALRRFPRVTLAGRIPHATVPAMLRRARYGLNLVPDRLPYSEQTSTKLLEYCAVGLPVVSTDYRWVRGFAQQHGARLAFVPGRATAARYAELLGPALDAQALAPPDVSALIWPHVMERLAVWRHLGLRP